jgi:HD-like signal output (HDOD) protein
MNSAQAAIAVDRLVLNIRELPSIPAMLADTLRVLDDPSTSAPEIEAVVLRDQALTAKTLRVVNSAAVGYNRRIETIRESLVLIGLRRVRGLVSAMAASGLYAKGIPGLVESRDLWAHALAASVWSAEIIEFRKLWMAQSAVIGALLHDLGIVILCQFATERYQGVLEQCRALRLPLHVVEQRDLGTTHAFVGATLCVKWQLPVAISQLVHHHHATATMQDKTKGVVMLANHLAHAGGTPPMPWAMTPELPEGLLELLGLNAEMLTVLLERKTVVQDRVHALLNAAG